MLIEWNDIILTFQITEVRGLNPDISKIYIEYLLPNVMKRRNKEKEARNGPFKKPTSQVTGHIQSECFILALHSCTKLKFVYYIGSCPLKCLLQIQVYLAHACALKVTWSKLR